MVSLLAPWSLTKGVIRLLTIWSPKRKQNTSAAKVSIPGAKARCHQPSASCPALGRGRGAMASWAAPGGSSRICHTGHVLSASKPAITANTVLPLVRAHSHSKPPPPRIIPRRYAPTWMALASPRSRAANTRTARPSVTMSCVAASRLNTSTASSRPRLSLPRSNRASVSAATTEQPCSPSNQVRRAPWWSTHGAHRNFSSQGKASSCSRPMAVSDQPASRISTGSASVKKPKGRPWAA